MTAEQTFKKIIELTSMAPGCTMIELGTILGRIQRIAEEVPPPAPDLGARILALPMPEPVSIIGHGPAANFTSVQPALKLKPHGKINCIAEDDVRTLLRAAAALAAGEAGK